MKGRILVIDDEKLICWSLKKDLSKVGYEVLTAQSAKEGLRLFEEENIDVVLLDIRLPDKDGKECLPIIQRKDPLAEVIMVTANDDVRTAVECMRSGAFTYLHKPFEFEELCLDIEKALEGRSLRKKVSEWENRQRGKYDFSNVVSESPQMKEILNMIQRVASAEASTVLLQGESGTGKDLIARTLHFSGARVSKPFMTINCAAIPETLLESELFGHEKGAFTDARQAKKGLVEEANGGSLFLDEIGDMPYSLQSKLLHLIDQKTFRKVGGTKEIEADIRIIAATNKDLKLEVKEGRFREDLFYRLNVIPVYLPPLRDRKEDVPALLSFFIAHFNKAFGKSVLTVTPKAMDILLNYSWPGNVREIKNVIERAMILNQENVIDAHHLPVEIDCQCVLTEKHPSKEEKSSTAQKRLPACLAGIPLEEIEKHVIRLTLEDANGNQSQAAKILKIGRDALRYKIQKFGLGEKEINQKMGEETQSELSN